MVDPNTVCCMCGDVGIPNKLFRCSRCLSRFQHSYCGNYYDEDTAEICDWCRSEERSNKPYNAFHHSKRPVGRSDYTAGERIKQHIGHEEAVGKTKNTNGGGGGGSSSNSSSGKPSGRRYKLLKDVLC